MTRSRSNTPPASQYKSRNSHHRHRVEFSPISSAADRRGSVASAYSIGSQSYNKHNHHGRQPSKESVNLEKDKRRRLELVANLKVKRELLLKRVRREKKIMLFSSILALVALFVWFVAVFTDHWFYVSQTDEQIQNAFNLTSPVSEEIFITSNTGLWKTCVTYQHVPSRQMRVECSYFSIFLTSQEEAKEGLNSHNEHVIDYTRAQICFAFISVLLMTMTIIAAFYTFKNSRYVYKRLASCLYFMTTITVLVVLEVLVTSVSYAASDKAQLYPTGAVVVYGFSFYMGWSVFLVYLVNGCMFLILSRKRKLDKDLEEDADALDGGLIARR